MPVHHDGAIRFVHLQGHIKYFVYSVDTQRCNALKICWGSLWSRTMKSTTTLLDKNGAKPERASLEISVLGQNSNCLRGLLRYTQTDQLTWMPFCEVTTSSSREGRTQKAACKQKNKGSLLKWPNFAIFCGVWICNHYGRECPACANHWFLRQVLQ